jgi:hypothetical protein
MTPADREVLLEQLHGSREAVRRAVAGLTEAQAQFRPAPDRWTAAECMEHVAVAERQMLRLATEFRAPAAAPSNPRLDSLILRGGTDRSKKMQAPDVAVPKGRYATFKEALEAFEKARERTLAYVSACQEDLRGMATNHPVVGTLDCYQCLLVLAVHPARHAKQIEELRSDPSFPKG